MATITRRGFSLEEARVIGSGLGIDWRYSRFDVDEFRLGMDFELHHGSPPRDDGFACDIPIIAGQLAAAHLRAVPDYYSEILGIGTRQEQREADVGGGGSP